MSLVTFHERKDSTKSTLQPEKKQYNVLVSTKFSPNLFAWKGVMGKKREHPAAAKVRFAQKYGRRPPSSTDEAFQIFIRGYASMCEIIGGPDWKNRPDAQDIIKEVDEKTAKMTDIPSRELQRILEVVHQQVFGLSIKPGLRRTSGVAPSSGHVLEEIFREEHEREKHEQSNRESLPGGQS